MPIRLALEVKIPSQPESTVGPTVIVGQQIASNFLALDIGFTEVINPIGKELEFGVDLWVEACQHERADIIAKTFGAIDGLPRES